MAHEMDCSEARCAAYRGQVFRKVNGGHAADQKIYAVQLKCRSYWTYEFTILIYTLIWIWYVTFSFNLYADYMNMPWKKKCQADVKAKESRNGKSLNDLDSVLPSNFEILFTIKDSFGFLWYENYLSSSLFLFHMYAAYYTCIYIYIYILYIIYILFLQKKGLLVHLSSLIWQRWNNDSS